MKIDYTLTLDDYMQMHLYIVQHSPQVRRMHRTSYLLYPLLMLMWAYIVSRYGFVGDAYFFVILAGIWLVLVPFYARWHQRRQSMRIVKESYGALAEEPTSLALDQGLLVEHTAGIETRATRSAITRVVETQGHLRIHLKTNVVMLIPKAQVATWEAFAAALKSALAGTDTVWQQDLTWK